MAIKTTKTCVLLIASVAVATAVTCSCRERKADQDRTPDDTAPRMELSQRDTARVLQLTEEFLELLKAGESEKALSMLHYLDKDHNVVDLPDSMARHQRMVFRQFPVLSYKIDNLVFQTEYDSQVKYTIEFFEKRPDDPRPNKTSFFIKPMRVGDEWFLTMFDSNTFRGGTSEIKN